MERPADPRLISFLIAVCVGVLVQCGGETSPEPLTTYSEPLTVPVIPENFLLDESGSTCTKTRFTFSATASYQETPPSEYVLERKRAPSSNWMQVARQPATDGKVLYDSTFIASTAESYQYRMRAKYSIDNADAYSNPSATVTREPRSCVVRTDLKISVFLMSPLNMALPYDQTPVHSTVFGSDVSIPSLKNFYKEVSAGYAATNVISAREAVQISGTVQGWYWLPHDRSHYCTPGVSPCRGILKNASAAIATWDVFADLKAAHPADYYVVVVNDDTTTNGGGLYRGAGNAFVGSSALNGGGFYTMAHELGHGMGFGEHPGIHCPGRPFPIDLYHTSSGGCQTGTYADMTDPMSGTGSIVHFNAYSKWIMGFLSGAVAETTIHAGQVLEYMLYDATSAYYGPYTQLILLKLDDYDTHYVIEYRRPVGFNAFAMTHRTLPYETLPRGVYVSLRPGRSIDSNLGNGNGPYTPYKSVGFLEPVIATGAQPFYDPDRKITVELKSDFGTSVVVRIKRD